MTPVDLAAGGEQLQLLKALVPYLAAGMQKPFVLLIKCMEIQNLAAFFSRPPVLSAQTADTSGKAYGFSEILSGISPYLPRQQRELFSQIQPLLEMLQLFSAMNRSGDESPDPTELFSSMLSPEQQAIFSIFSQPTEKETPKQMDRNWTNNPSLQNIDPQKLEMLLKLTEQGKGKAQKDLLPFLMAAANQSRKNGMSFSTQETDAIIEVLKTGKSPAEVQKIEQLRGLMKTFLSKKR